MALKIYIKFVKPAISSFFSTNCRKGYGLQLQKEVMQYLTLDNKKIKKKCSKSPPPH